MSRRPCCILWRVVLPVLAVGVALGAAGCARKTGTITGQVTFKDKPLKGGVVAFLNADGTAASGVIDGHGMYTVAGAHVGEAKVTVQSMPAPPPFKPGSGKVPSEVDVSEEPEPQTFVPIPARYQDKNKSGLSYTVQEGQQEFPLPLKP